jgi:hypothetical protein
MLRLGVKMPVGVAYPIGVPEWEVGATRLSCECWVLRAYCGRGGLYSSETGERPWEMGKRSRGNPCSSSGDIAVPKYGSYGPCCRIGCGC